MPVMIGAPPQNGFETPLGLLRDCHRRIEHFLQVLDRVADDNGAWLNDVKASALQAGLDYFRNAAPKHTADEEESLFPRLRRVHDTEVRQALARVDELERDHRSTEMQHAELDALGRKWLSMNRLTPEEALRFKRIVDELIRVYEEHIRREDSEIFPLAERVLSRTDQAAVGREMARRRGLAEPAV